ncbi:MAG TPA: hypothetical protein VFU47_02245, partial [Armatimonadota bacterium]|nr:hypothetical protein [Armatimonadota bacterium]
MALRRLTSTSGLLCALLLLASAGCRLDSPETPAIAPVSRGPVPIHLSPDPWVLTTDRWEASYRGPYLGNGALGATLTAAGSSRSPSGWEPGYGAGVYKNES